MKLVALFRGDLEDVEDILCERRVGVFRRMHWVIAPPHDCQCITNGSAGRLCSRFSSGKLTGVVDLEVADYAGVKHVLGDTP
jgi:hypothetical protein